MLSSKPLFFILRPSGLIRKAARISIPIPMAPWPSPLAFLVSSRTRFSMWASFKSAESSMVITRSSGGINSERAFKKVVFPAPVPPLTKILYRAAASIFKRSAASLVTLPYSRSRSMVIGSGNFRIVRIGPFSATGSSTTWTLEPSSSLASTMGDAVLTVRLTRLTICRISSRSCSRDSKDFSHLRILPSVSTNTSSGPLTMISVIPGSSTSSCRISSLRKESNSSF